MLAVALVVPGPVEPELPLAGLPLLLRAVLTLQQHGASTILVAVPTGHDIRNVVADPRVVVPLCCVEVDESLSQLAERLDGPFLFARHDLIVDPSVASRLDVADLASLSSWVPENAWSVEVRHEEGPAPGVEDVVRCLPKAG